MEAWQLLHMYYLWFKGKDMKMEPVLIHRSSTGLKLEVRNPNSRMSTWGKGVFCEKSNQCTCWWSICLILEQQCTWHGASSSINLEAQKTKFTVQWYQVRVWNKQWGACVYVSSLDVSFYCDVWLTRLILTFYKVILLLRYTVCTSLF